MRLITIFSTYVPISAFVPSHVYRTIVNTDSLHSSSASVISATRELEKSKNDSVEVEQLSVDDFRLELDELTDEIGPLPTDDADKSSLPSSVFSSPADYENAKFQLDDNVQFWIDYNRRGSMKEKEFMTTVADVTNRFAQQGNDALGYWLRHTSRTGYFVTNAALGVLASTLNERLRSKTDVPEDSFTKVMAQPSVIARLLADVALCYEQDYENVVNEKYRAPYDMYTINSQNNPFFIGRQTSRFITEAVGTMTRRNRGSEEDKRVRLNNDEHDDVGIYPEYYKTAFHYQTEGWMSRESANVYETSTETLFLGRQDAMQRTALVPLVEFSKDGGSRRKLGRPMRVLEVACGTGRFMTFARDNLPPDSEFTAVDLSPFYLEKAKENDKNWRSIQTNKNIQPVNIVQAKGENLPFADEEFDAVICMYLYHEIPRGIRTQISAEMSRVTKIGGRVILTDSLQKGDRPVMDDKIGNFEKMNEPFYRDYIEDFLPKHFEASGLECLTKSVRGSTKTLTFRKPF